MACSACGGGSFATTSTSSSSTSSCSCGGSGSPLNIPCTTMFSGGVSRTRFFDGMVLSAIDLDNEQRYWRRKRQLTNRALGQGVVWGLRTEWLSGTGTVRVNPGYALDCCGNDVVVTECQLVPGSNLANGQLPAVAAILAAARAEELVLQETDDDATVTPKAHLVLRYAELPEEPRAVCTNGCSTGGATRYEATRVRESAQLCLAPVPPPTNTSPVQTFLDSLQGIYDALDGTPDLALLFPDDGIGEPQLTADSEPPFQIVLRVRLEYLPVTPVGGTPPTVDPMWPTEKVVILRPSRPTSGAGWEWRPDGSFDLPLIPDMQVHAKIAFEIRPHGDWRLLSGEVALDPGATAITSVMAPFGLRLTWGADLWLDARGTSESVVPETHADFFVDLGLGPFLDGDQRVDLSDLAIRIELGWEGTTTAPHLVIRGPGGPADPWATCPDVVVTDLDRSHEQCTELMWPDLLLLSEGDHMADPRVAVLGGLYAFLLRTMGTITTQTDEEWSGLQVTAHWAVMLAWRLMFGVDATVDGTRPQARRDELAKLLQALLVNWCKGFLYPGPRCTTSHHGVVLGTVTLSPSGHITGFDPWAGRRHVWTGPLAEHWLGQVGFAAPDVMVGRILSTICCLAGVARRPLPEVPDLTFPTMSRDLAGAMVVTTATFTPPDGAVRISGATHLVVEDQAALLARLAAEGFQTEQRSSGTLDFVASLVRSWLEGGDPPGGRRLRIESLASSGTPQVHLITIERNDGPSGPPMGGPIVTPLTEERPPKEERPNTAPPPKRPVGWRLYERWLAAADTPGPTGRTVHRLLDAWSAGPVG
ncbi:MAG TPA: hypothetical protein PKA64_16480, partial [Myxococcota bacterium]|nr:hypothetical protein [Myxococcota bacterium]